jgi:hypothetical protein
MVDILDGIRNSLNIAQAKVKIDMSDEIALLDSQEAPFTLILSKLKKKRTGHNPRIDWLEGDLLPFRATVPAAAAVGATNIAVYAPDGAVGCPVKPFDILFNPATGERMSVSAVDYSVSSPALNVTVIRGYSDSTAVAIEQNSERIIMAAAMPENSLSPIPLSTKEVDKWNYTQIIRTPLGASNTELATATYGGNDLALQVKMRGIEHARAISLAAYFGKRGIDLTNFPDPRRTMGGVAEFIENGGNVVSFANTQPTWDNFTQSVMRELFTYGGRNKIMLTGPNFAMWMDRWAMAGIRTRSEAKVKYGITVETLRTTFGDLPVVIDPLLARAEAFSTSAFILDLDNIGYVPLEGRDTAFHVNLQENDRDGVKQEYITECSIEVRLPKTHMMLTGVKESYN